MDASQSRDPTRDRLATDNHPIIVGSQVTVSFRWNSTEYSMRAHQPRIPSGDSDERSGLVDLRRRVEHTPFAPISRESNAFGAATPWHESRFGKDTAWRPARRLGELLPTSRSGDGAVTRSTSSLDAPLAIHPVHVVMLAATNGPPVSATPTDFRGNPRHVLGEPGVTGTVYRGTTSVGVRAFVVTVFVETAFVEQALDQG
jgi:hypothetical protein